MSDNDPKKAETKKLTISDFIEENYKLISTLAFLTALTVFAGNLTLKPLGQLLSFLGWVATVLIWCELCGKFPGAKQATAPLVLFGSTLGFIGMVIQAYCLIEFSALWGKLFYPILFFLSAYVLMTFFLVLSKVSPTYQRMTLPVYRRSKHLFWGLHALCILLVWVLLLFVTPQLNRLLIHIHQSLEKTNLPSQRTDPAATGTNSPRNENGVKP